jgi:type III restriction enzyme
MVNHIGYEPDPEEDWWNAEVVFLEAEEKAKPAVRGGREPENGIDVAPAGGSNLFDHVIHDSIVERDFARYLENNTDHVKLFTKLPRRFRVRTPVGEYSPDWAILYDKDGVEQLYLVRETKGTLNLDDLDWDEAMRIRFAHQHFAIAPAGKVDYYFTTSGAGLRIDEQWQDNAG